MFKLTIYNIRVITDVAATGRQNSPHIHLGRGAWEILGAAISVSHTGGPNYAQKCHITYREELGSGGLLPQNIASGFVGPDNPFCISYRPIVKGPGKIFSVVNQHEANVHEFQITYRRVVK